MVSSVPRRRLTSIALAVLPVFGAIVAIAVVTRPPTNSRDKGVSAGDLNPTEAGIRLSVAAPQWKYLEVAVARLSAPLTPLPAPARVLTSETRSAPVFAPLAGRVESVPVQLGQEVKPGDRLLSVRSSLLPELRHAADSARAGLAVKSAMVDRVRDLVALRAVPEKELLLAEEAKREAELALKAAEGKRRSLRLTSLDDSGLYWIKAARSGTVVEKQALVGMEVGPDRPEPLLSIADLSEVLVVADVLEAETGTIKPGQLVKISGTVMDDETIEGTVEHVAPFVDPMRRTVAVRVRVLNSKRALRPNAFARVTFPVDGEPRVIVPQESIVTGDQSPVVFVKYDRPGDVVELRDGPSASAASGTAERRSCRAWRKAKRTWPGGALGPKRAGFGALAFDAGRSSRDSAQESRGGDSPGSDYGCRRVLGIPWPHCRSISGSYRHTGERDHHRGWSAGRGDRAPGGPAAREGAQWNAGAGAAT